MTATSHVTTGAVIGAAVVDPWIALPIALASHFVLDSIPHMGFGNHLGKSFNHVLITDLILTTTFITVLIVIQPQHWITVVLCAFLAIAPDAMWIPNFLRERKHQKAVYSNFIMRFHKNIQWYEKPSGALIEIPWIVVMTTLLIRLKA